MRWVAPAVLAAVVFAGVACGGEVPSGPRSVTKDGWEEWLGAPAWVAAPPLHEGFAPFVVAGQSNMLNLAHRADPKYVPDFRLEVAERLRPVLGADADAVVAKIDAKPTSVRKGFYLQLPKRGENWPGAQTYTAYELWEMPIAPVAAAVPEASREAASRALQRAEPEGIPAWESGKSAPGWVDAPTASEGFATVLIGQDCDRADVARINAMAIGPRWMADRITRALEGVVGRSAAFEAGRHAETWRVLRARAVVAKGPDHVAWTLWDVSLERVVETLPEANRAAARRALETPLRP